MIKYTLTLISDAHTGTGIGGEVVNDYVACDELGNPYIREKHLKGLLRETLRDIIGHLKESDNAKEREFANSGSKLLDQTFGKAGWRPHVNKYDESVPEENSFVHFTNAVMPKSIHPSPKRTITRTAINPKTGSVLQGSLRTNEAVCAGTVFEGKIYGCDSGPSELLAKLSLLSLQSVGGKRNRGSGCCVVDIIGEKQLPGDLLLSLKNALENKAPSVVKNAQPVINVESSNEKHGTVLFELIFKAESPLLCPERPEVSNILQSGFSIPASAVQGALLTRLDCINSNAASRCFEDSRFRAWPLIPCGTLDTSMDKLPYSVRVSLTHRVIKHIVDVENIKSNDEALSIWDQSPNNAPMKAQDGVLLGIDDMSLGIRNSVKLWRSADMPRVFTTHGAHNDAATTDGRNLYSLESMAPMIWRGFVALPAELEYILKDSFNIDNLVAFGKSRSVRGLGTLEMRPIENGLLPFTSRSWREQTILISQSPIALPEETSGSSIQEVFHGIAQKWANKHELGDVDVVWAVSGIQFGWNRHGKSGAAAHGRTPAVRVILPGAVIRLKNIINPILLSNALIAGVGEMRERGFGALLPHPGKADSLYRNNPTPPELKSDERVKEGVIKAFSFFQTSSFNLSRSQVSALLARVKMGKEEAKTFLENQKKRGSSGWEQWEGAFTTLQNIINGDLAKAEITLSVLRDLVASKQEGRH